MLKLSIMSEEELTHIFGDLDAYIPLHEGKICYLIFVSIWTALAQIVIVIVV